MDEDFVHLNFQSEYSTLDSTCSLKKLNDQCAEKGFKSVALTDVCNVRGTIKFYKNCTQASDPIKPILGSKILMVDGDHKYPLILLSKTNDGFENLRKLSHDSQTEGFSDNKATTDMDTLRKYSKDLICISTDLNGSVNKLLRRDKLQEGYAEASRFKDIFGEDYYLEVQKNEQLDQDKVNRNVFKIAKKLGTEIVATNDVRYYEEAHYHAYLVLRANKKHTTINSKRFSELRTNQRYFKSYAEMKDAFKDYPETIFRNTVSIAEKCNVHFEFGGMLLPKFELGEGYTDDWEYLRYLAFEGLKERGHFGKKEYMDRLEDELFDVKMVFEVKQYNFARYFLMVWDYVNAAIDRGCRVGVGRGCLTYDTLVRVESDEFKKLGEIEVGDRVLNMNGEYDKVINTMVYDCDEELINFKVRHDSNVDRCSMTSDHKVLILKNPFKHLEKKGWIDGYSKLDLDEYFVNDNLQWVQAQNVERGDYFVRSVDFEDEKDLEVIDLAKYADGCAYDDEFIYEPHPIDRKGMLTLRKISKATGICRSSLNLVRSGKIESLRDKSVVLRLKKYLEDNGGSLKELENYKTTEFVKIKRFLKVDKEFLYFYGIYVGDGWNRKTRFGTAFHSENNILSKNRIRAYFEYLGLKIYERKSPNKKLIQLYVNSVVFSALISDICPNYSYERSVDERFMKLPKDKIVHLLDGLMNSDGHIGVKKCYDTTNLKLAYQVRKLFESIGCVCAVRKREKNILKNHRESYKVVISDNNKSSNYHNNGKYLFCRVMDKEIVQNDSGKVYDISVEKDPSYHTDNFIVHNSACGSLLLYCLKITNLDPIEYGLYWWRFLTVDKKYEMNESDFV